MTCSFRISGAFTREPLINPATRHPGIAKRYPGPSDFAFQSLREKSLDPGFRRDDGQKQSLPKEAR